MNERICVVFGAGEYYGGMPTVPRGAFVVAADGGLDHARELGVTADMVVGDFDSLEGERPANGAHTVALPAEKDDPDMLSALKIGWASACRTFHIYGALGGRIDHTIANIQLLALLASHGGIGFLHGDGQVVTALADGTLRFPAWDCEPGAMVSVFAHSDTAAGVCERGLKYELHDATMTDVHVNGLSNEFLPGRPAMIEVGHGTLVVTFPTNAPLPTAIRRHGFSGDLGALDTDVSAALAVPAPRV